MKKGLFVTSTAIAVVLGALFAFKTPLLEAAKSRLTSDMFVTADTDGYDKGLPIGAKFPALKALYKGEVITDLRPFIHDKGMVFIANRSADW